MFKILALLTWILTFLLLPSHASAALFINEFSSADNPEWVEIYNSGSEQVNLEGWKLLFQDNLDTSQKTVFGASDAVGPLTYKIFERGYTGTGGWLRNDGDTLILIDSLGNTVDSIKYGDITGAVISLLDAGESAIRNPDGGTSWFVSSTPTSNAPNSMPAPTSTPTPTSAPNPTSTPTPKPTNTPTPTQKPASSSVTSTSTPTPKPKNTPTSAAPISQSDEEVVLGIQKDDTLTTQEELDTTPSAKTASWKTPTIAAALIIPGLGLVGFSLYSYFQKAKGGNIENGDSEDI